MNVNVNIKDLPFIGRLTPNQSLETSRDEEMYKKIMIDNYTKELEHHPEAVRTFTSLSLELMAMGYKPEIFTACFLVHRFTTLEEAIDILGKTDDLWNHRFVDYYNNHCFICNEEENTHRTFGNILQRKQSKIKDIDFSDNRALLKKMSSFQGISVKKEESRGKICNICLSVIPKGSEYCLKCMHQFCNSCVKEYVEEEISNARVKIIRCPEEGCTEMLDGERIKTLVNDAFFAKYQKFLERERIRGDKKLFLCPFPNCEGYARRKKPNEKDVLLPIEGDNGPLLQENNINNNLSFELDKVKYTCSLGHDFCGKCKRLWHEDDCLEDKELKEDSEAMNAVVKRCPKCKIPINKFAGCNHITCPCGHQFCWICYETYTEDHYNRPGTPCYGFQFDAPHPDIIQERNFAENHEIIVFFIFIFFHTVVIVNQLVRRNINPENGEGRSKGALYLMILMISFIIFLFSVIFNLFFLVHMINGLVTMSHLQGHNCSKMMLIMIYFILFFVLFFPGIIFSTFWMIFVDIYALVKIIVA